MVVRTGEARRAGLAGMVMLGLCGCITPPTQQSGEATPAQTGAAGAPVALQAEEVTAAPVGALEQGTVVAEVENWLGVSAETAASIVERVFSDLGQPNGYIRGEEASGAVGAGLRYGRGELVLADGHRQPVFWQGPSVGWDIGGNASKTFTLVYDIPQSDYIYRRFPGVEGSAYLVGGVGVNYQRAEGITLVPMRAGVGARLGANVGYLAYSKRQRVLPF